MISSTDLIALLLIPPCHQIMKCVLLFSSDIFFLPDFDILRAVIYRSYKKMPGRRSTKLNLLLAQLGPLAHAEGCF